MARPLRIEYEGAFYHIIQRGTERKPIFISDFDRNKFLCYLDYAHTAYGAMFHTYILMNNHYHLILETPRANLSKIMHFINTSYAVYFNTKRKRTGPLYQGRYKSILVQQDMYLHHLSRYIHLNPVRAKITTNPIEYQWSSYKYFTSNNKSPRWLNTDFILSMFDKTPSSAKRLYKQFVLNEIGNEKKIIEENTIMGFILGSPDFLKSIEERFIKSRKDAEIPVLNQLNMRNAPSLEDIQKRTLKKVPNDKRLRKRISIYLSRRFTQKTLNEIGAFHGKIRDTAVSQAVARVKAERAGDREKDGILKELERELKV